MADSNLPNNLQPRYKNIKELIEQSNLTAEELKLVQPLIDEYIKKHGALLEQGKIHEEVKQQSKASLKKSTESNIGFLLKALELGNASQRLADANNTEYLKQIEPKDGYNN